MSVVYGGIEAGGTKFICAVGTGPDHMSDPVRIETTTPQETLCNCVRFFERHTGQDALAAIGIASFGPVDPRPGSPTFGYITTTPKEGWARTDFAGTIGRALGVPVGFDTDVNVAGLGEHTWGAAQGLDTFIYLTVGTGIGGGGMVNGRLMHGLIHPEMGHMRIPRDPADPFEGDCPFHHDCLEGLASGQAMERRWGQPAETLPQDHPAWDMEAHYLALGLVNMVLTLSPQRLVVGGGVMGQPRLLPLIRNKVQVLLNEYVRAPEILEGINQYIVAPALGTRAGVLGALALARTQVARGV